VFKPAVVVFVDGEPKLHVAGADGLTGTVLHNKARTVEWVNTRYGVTTEVVEIGGCGTANQPYAGGFTKDEGAGASNPIKIAVKSDPKPDLIPDPGPTPDPDPMPDPGPTPDPDPMPDPGPTPDPDPTPDPGPAPDPGPGPGPDPVFDPLL
jgi:hypothetical protein